MNSGPTALRRALMLVVGLVISATAALVADPAAAAEPMVNVELTSVAVSGSKPSDQVEVRGRVSNPTGATVYGLQLALWRARDPIDGLVGVRQAADEDNPRGLILPDGYAEIVPREQGFAAGATSDFTLTASLSELGFDTPGKVYLIGARALGKTDVNQDYPVNVGQAVTSLSLPGKTRVPVTRVVLLTAAPTKLANNVFANEDLTAQLQGRLDKLLAAAAAPGMSWVIDPALLDEVLDQSDGYQVMDDDDIKPGTGQQAALDWLTRFAQLNQSAGARTVFALPDLNGAAAARQGDVRTRALAATAEAGLETLPLVVIPTGAIYPGAERFGPGLDDAPVLASNVATVGALQTAADGRRVLASAVDLSSDQFDAAQLAIAQTLVAGSAGQLRVLREPEDLAADAAATRAWMTPRTLGELLASPPSGAAQLTDVGATPLTKAQFSAIRDLSRDFDAYSELAPESDITAQSTQVLTRAASSAWIAKPEGQRALLKALDRVVGPAAMAKAVTMDVSPRFVMSGRTAKFPVTVTNHLAEPVQVKVVVIPDNPQRLAIPDTEVISVPPGHSETVTISPEANANGIATARIWVTTEEGRRITPEKQITIEMTNLGLVGWVIVIVSGLVVIGATGLRLWQVRRRATAEAPDGPPGSPSDQPEAAAAAEPEPVPTRKPQDG